MTEVRDPNILKKVGRLLGELHRLEMPLVKEPIWLWHTIERFVDLVDLHWTIFSIRYIADLPTDLSKFEIEEDRQIYQELRSVCVFSTEFEELK